MAITINVNLDEILAALKNDLDFTGNADKYIKVNATADGFEFATVSGGGATWGSITGTLSNQTDLQTALNNKYDTSNPAGYITGVAWGSITGTLSSQTDLQSALDLKANLAGAAFTGAVSVTTSGAGDTLQLTNSGSGTTLNILNSGSGDFFKIDTNKLVVSNNGNVAIDTNTLFVDAVNNRVGIGTATPSCQFEQYLANQTGVSNIGFKYSVQNTQYSRVLGFQHHAYYGQSVLEIFDGQAGNFWLIKTGVSGAIRTSNTGSFTVGTPWFFISDHNYDIANAYFFGHYANKSIAIGSNSATTANLNVHCTSISKVGQIIQAAAGQTENTFQIRNSAAAVLTFFANNGAWSPASLADGDAANGTVYYSTTALKLVYKDSGGTVNNLY